MATEGVPVATGIVGDTDLAAVGALLDMATEGRGAAGLDGRHDPTLPAGQSGGVFGAIGGAVAAEDIRQLSAGFTARAQLGGVTARPRRSSGLVVSAIRCVATWV